MEAGMNKEPKHIVIDNAMENLNNSITQLEKSLDRLQGNEHPPVDKANKIDAPCFTQVYFELSEKIAVLTDRVRIVDERLKEMLI